MMGRTWSLLLILVVLASGCTINRDIMFRTDTDYEFDVLPDSTDAQFRIQPNDIIQFRLFANDGFRMIDLVSPDGGMNVMNINRLTFNYLVEFDGLAELPLIGRVKLSGLTLREAEFLLEERYVEFYNRPFVQISVSNRRVVVYPGDGGSAKVVNLDYNNTTLLEALAQAGGLAKRGNATKVKLFRRDDSGNRLIYMFDLSDIEGLRYGDLVMQADDIVYVEPNPEIARELLYDLTPLITLLTSTVLVLGIVRGLQ
ncbi:MAG: polysaccharide biosynthesis/export family protein [Flavobacteriales bacterium]|nr:polysaccharide biosynthesis/export family protein [Flavobacteriales bacterium]